MLHMALCYKTFKIYNFIKIIKKKFRFNLLIESGSHCIALSWPGTRSVDQSGLQLTENHQPLLEIKAIATTPSNFHVSELNRLTDPSQWPGPPTKNSELQFIEEESQTSPPTWSLSWVSALPPSRFNCCDSVERLAQDGPPQAHESN